MANWTYVPSDCIYIFPCAARTYGTITASKFLTQYNLTHFIGGGKSYNLTKAGDRYMRFSINGYFVQIDYTGQQGQTWWKKFQTTAKPEANDVLYAYISLVADVAQSGNFSDVIDVNTQPKLTSFEGDVRLDSTQGSTSEFTALKLAFLANETAASALPAARVKLATVKSASPIDLQWQLYSESLTFDNPDETTNGIKIELSQNPIDKSISARAAQVLLGTDELNIDTIAYGTTTTPDTPNPSRLQVRLASNGKKLKAQLLGLVKTDDIADKAITFGKLKVSTTTSRTVNTNSLGAKLQQDGTSGNIKVQLEGTVHKNDIAAGTVTADRLQTSVQTTLGRVGTLQIYDETQKTTDWYTVRVEGNALKINKANN